MLVKPEIILGSNKLENTKRVLTVYAEIVGNPSLYNSTAAQKIKSSILQMHNDPFFNEHSALLWDALPDKCKQSISTFMK